MADGDGDTNKVNDVICIVGRNGNADDDENKKKIKELTPTYGTSRRNTLCQTLFEIELLLFFFVFPLSIFVPNKFDKLNLFILQIFGTIINFYKTFIFL